MMKGCEENFSLVSESGTAFQILPPTFKSGMEMKTKELTLPKGKGQRILLVDDEVDILDLMGIFLSGIGYKVETFTSSPMALECLESRTGDFDIVLTDLIMPGLTGLELAKRIRQLRPDLPVILITGHRKVLESCGKLPEAICEVLLKPFNLTAMAASIAHHLGRAERKR